MRDRHTVGDSWKEAPLRYGEDQEDFIRGLIAERAKTPWPHFEEYIVGEAYPRLQATFQSRETILASSDVQLFDALTTLHSFHDRLRYYKGGMATWREAFGAANDPKSIREVLAELIFGAGAVEERIARVTFDPNPEQALRQFGRSNVQELIGWCNKDELPIINGRTTKVLRYLGFTVQQLNER